MTRSSESARFRASAADAAPPPLRVAVFSDTHDRFPADLPARMAEADEIWHLGDVCDPATLVEFEQLGPPLTVVAGNNDWHPAWPLFLRVERHGREFHLEHIAPRRAPPGAEFVLSGHTHVPSDHIDAAGVRWLNPGCISYPRAGVRGFAWLTISPGGAVAWSPESL